MSLVLFACSTLIGWSFYGETGVVCLLDPGAVPLLWVACVCAGAMASANLIASGDRSASCVSSAPVNRRQ